MKEKCEDLRLDRRFIKCYKKHTLAIFLSFTLTFLLLTTMVVLIHTNHRIANIQAKTLYTPSDCSVGGLSKQQVEQLKQDEDIEHIAVEQVSDRTFSKNRQTLFLLQSDYEFITMTSTITGGRMPKKQGEVVAERWVLLNLGIQPQINQVFEIEEQDTGERVTLTLVGLLSDMSMNKQYGVMNLYTPIDVKGNAEYTTYLQLKSDVKYEPKKERWIKELGISPKQIKECPAKEDYKELLYTDVKVIGIILFICMVVFYGIYRITMMTREKQYGILRAIGMTRGQLQKMILLELYQIYAVSVPVGVAAGLLVALFIVNLSGDRDTIVYLYNQKITFQPIVPVEVILCCIAIVAVTLGIIGYFAGKKVAKTSPIAVISGMQKGQQDGNNRGITIEYARSKSSTLFCMGLRYIVRDKKTSCFVILTICLGVTLFTGLAYRIKTLETYRADTKEMWYLNGQYHMGRLSFDNTEQGISRKSAEEIQQLSAVRSVKMASGIPIRVIDEDSIKRNDKYYNKLNENLTEVYGYGAAGSDGVNQVYKSVIYGYNKVALKELEQHVLSGSTNLTNIKTDEIILSVLRVDDTKANDLPGSFREGTPLMQYKVGDAISVKYRKDLKTDSEEYASFADVDAEYIYKKYKVKAIVSFAYMQDCNRTVYPLFITKDSEIQKLAPKSSYQCIYIDGSSNASAQEQIELEQQLIKIGSQNSNISTRSIISETEKNEMFYHKQLVYVCGIAVVSLLLVLMNIINNLRYRMQTRTREICMLRAIGMSVAMTKRMMLFENVVLGMVSIALAFLISHPTLAYLYRISDMRAMGHGFQYDYRSFIIVSVVALIICVVLSFHILKGWKTRHIVAEMGRSE